MLSWRTVKFDAYMSRSRAVKVQITAGSVGRCGMDQLFIERCVNIIEENNIILVMLGRNVCYNDNLT